MRALRIYTASAMATGLSTIGHVLANLAGPDGKRIRCEFQLIRSNEGMKGGGQGRCQLASGKTIRADFSPS
jgi:hypothetical protein